MGNYIKLANRYYLVESVNISNDIITVDIIDIIAFESELPNTSFVHDVPYSVFNTFATINDDATEWLVSDDGPYRKGNILKEEEVAIQRKQDYLLSIIKNKRDNSEHDGVKTPFGTVDSDDRSQQKIIGAVLMALIMKENFSVPWRMKDDTVVQLDDQQMIQMGILVGVKSTTYQAIKNYFDDKVLAATSIDYLLSIEPQILSNWDDIDVNNLA